MKKGYQLVFREFGKIDGNFNKECGCVIYATREKAWFEAMADCKDDTDISYLLDKVAQGLVTVKEVQLEGYEL